MRLRYKPWANDYIKNNPKLFLNSYINKSELYELFNQFDNINIEVGCGKGQYILEKAKNNPQNLYIAIEKFESVIVFGAKELEKNKLNNLKFYSGDIKELKDNEKFTNQINEIYINFSDPWPKKRHKKRRLTSEFFLNIYYNFLKENGEVIQKTDNDNLFEYSVKEVANDCRFNIEKILLDLHESDTENIKTEYEKKFSSLGFKIKYMKFIKRSKNENRN